MNSLINELTFGWPIVRLFYPLGSSAYTPVSKQLPAKLTPALFNVTIHNLLPTWFVHDRHGVATVTQFQPKIKNFN